MEAGAGADSDYDEVGSGYDTGDDGDIGLGNDGRRGIGSTIRSADGVGTCCLLLISYRQ
jgi:hypothetical protein